MRRRKLGNGSPKPALLRSAERVVGGWGPEKRDAVLYAGSALFAISTAEISSIALYQQWGKLAVGPYATGAVLSALGARRARQRANAEVPAVAGAVSPKSPGAFHWNGSRTAIFLLVLVGATLLPLSLEVLWRSDSGGIGHVQPETQVVEQSGVRVAHGQDPYQVIGSHGTQVKAPPGSARLRRLQPVPAVDVGLRAAAEHRRITTAYRRPSRSPFITVIVVIAALGLCRGATGPRVLALQAMTVLPTAALPLATGGDDLPVAAFMLLGLVLMQRRRPFGSGIALGIAASMKITAWPFAGLAFLVARDREGKTGKRPAMWILGGMGAVMLPAILPTISANPSAFVENVVRFPLGLAGIARRRRAR